jgi:hypothetical protein
MVQADYLRRVGSDGADSPHTPDQPAYTRQHQIQQQEQQQQQTP